MELFTDEYFMRIAIREAEEAFEEEEVPIGAVVVMNNQVIARGHNRTEALNDATAHAEMQTITAASNHLNSKYLKNCTLYVTVEPCPMCAGAIAWAQLGTLVYGAEDPKKGYTTYCNTLLHPQTLVKKGILAEECQKLMKDFFRNKR